MLDTAVRPGEVCRLRLGDINFEQRKARIRNHEDRKDGKQQYGGMIKDGEPRTVYFTKETAEYLKSWLTERANLAAIHKIKHDCVFLARDGEPMNPDLMNVMFDRIKRANKLDYPFFPYIMRHTSITMMVQSGVPLNTVMRIAGHSSLQVTDKYVTTDEEADRRIFNERFMAAL